jgi:hypothetical protein
MPGSMYAGRERYAPSPAVGTETMEQRFQPGPSLPFTLNQAAIAGVVGFYAYSYKTLKRDQMIILAIVLAVLVYRERAEKYCPMCNR